MSRTLRHLAEPDYPHGYGDRSEEGQVKVLYHFKTRGIISNPALTTRIATKWNGHGQVLSEGWNGEEVFDHVRQRIKHYVGRNVTLHDSLDFKVYAVRCDDLQLNGITEILCDSTQESVLPPLWLELVERNKAPLFLHVDIVIFMKDADDQTRTSVQTSEEVEGQPSTTATDDASQSSQLPQAASTDIQQQDVSTPSTTPQQPMGSFFLKLQSRSSDAESKKRQLASAASMDRELFEGRPHGEELAAGASSAREAGQVAGTPYVQASHGRIVKAITTAAAPKASRKAPAVHHEIPPSSAPEDAPKTLQKDAATHEKKAQSSAPRATRVKGGFLISDTEDSARESSPPVSLNEVKVQPRPRSSTGWSLNATNPPVHATEFPTQDHLDIGTPSTGSSSTHAPAHTHAHAQPPKPLDGLCAHVQPYNIRECVIVGEFSTSPSSSSSSGPPLRQRPFVYAATSLHLNSRNRDLQYRLGSFTFAGDPITRWDSLPSRFEPVPHENIDFSIVFGKRAVPLKQIWKWVDGARRFRKKEEQQRRDSRVVVELWVTDTDPTRRSQDTVGSSEPYTISTDQTSTLDDLGEEIREVCRKRLDKIHGEGVGNTVKFQISLMPVDEAYTGMGYNLYETSRLFVPQGDLAKEMDTVVEECAGKRRFQAVVLVR